ncbi:hypothetical protein AN958_09426 [Leucoagaricus sp. SymC.cos]|nr:hypothetical protein AN958_09426 [Leucoagaricus sp. SymC.cos]
MIIGALASSGGGMAAGTLSAWTSHWGMSTPPVFRAGAGLWGTLDVWGGALVALVYGVSRNHPAFKSFLPTLAATPVFSQVIAFIYPYLDPSLEGLAPLKHVEARALGGFVLTILFGLRVYNIHWSGSTPSSRQAEGKKEEKRKQSYAAVAKRAVAPKS